MPSLTALDQAGHEILLVVTQPDRPGGRGLKPVASPVKIKAAELGLPLYQPERIRNEEAQAHIRATGADLMVVVAYGQILPASLLEAPRLGTVNVHASLLPRHRGPAPVEWAILSGDRETGVTIMQMDAGVDTGPILAQEPVPIGPDETAGQLEARLAGIGAKLLLRTTDRMQAGEIEATPQPSAGASHAPRLKSEDGKLDNDMTAVEIDRRVRALAERVGVWLEHPLGAIKVLKGHPLKTNEDGGLLILTRDGTYVVEEVQPAGGRRMSAEAWTRGRR